MSFSGPNVTVVSCLYGDTHTRFLSEWSHSVRNLNPRPADVVVCTDRAYTIDAAFVHIPMEQPWEHRQAFYLQKAVKAAMTEWVWVLDIDDRALPDALQGLDEVAADVWQMGYVNTAGARYCPPALPNHDYLESPRNMYVGGSAFRVGAFHEVGGYRDVALQDWDLWRRLAENGAAFEASGRVQFHYTQHEASRTDTELTMGRRPDHLAEMML